MFFKIIGVLAVFLLALWYCPLKINLSPSMPLGLYWGVPTASHHRGDWVAVCLPSSIAKEGLERGYLSRGLCASGTMPVLKMIIAIPNDEVIVAAQTIRVNGKTYWAPRQNRDHRGNPVRSFIGDGHYRSRGYWLYGLGNILRSWDSRYYGGIDEQQIIARYRLLLPF